MISFAATIQRTEGRCSVASALRRLAMAGGRQVRGGDGMADHLCCTLRNDLGGWWIVVGEHHDSVAELRECAQLGVRTDEPAIVPRKRFRPVPSLPNP